jgi:cytochrome c
VHKEIRATQAKSTLRSDNPDGASFHGISPFRWAFVIVPLAVVVVGAANLMGLWTTSSQQTAREDRQRQAERHPPSDEAPAIGAPSGVIEQAPARVEAPFDAAVVVARLAAANPEEGASAFRFCSPCHAGEKNAPHKVGPNLWGIVGSPKAALPGFNYSIALKAKGGTWSYEDLAEYLHNPRTYAPGTSMAFAGIVDSGRLANLLAYMRTLSDAPEPLPAQVKR